MEKTPNEIRANRLSGQHKTCIQYWRILDYTCLQHAPKDGRIQYLLQTPYNSMLWINAFESITPNPSLSLTPHSFFPAFSGILSFPNIPLRYPTLIRKVKAGMSHCAQRPPDHVCQSTSPSRPRQYAKLAHHGKSVSKDAQTKLCHSLSDYSPHIE